MGGKVAGREFSTFSRETCECINIIFCVCWCSFPIAVCWWVKKKCAFLCILSASTQAGEIFKIDFKRVAGLSRSKGQWNLRVRRYSNVFFRWFYKVLDARYLALGPEIIKSKSGEEMTPEIWSLAIFGWRIMGSEIENWRNLTALFYFFYVESSSGSNTETVFWVEIVGALWFWDSNYHPCSCSAVWCSAV